MKRRFIICVLLVACMAFPVRAEEPIRWVDFQIPYESLRYAMEVDIRTSEQEKHISWIDILALAGCRTGGKCGLSEVKKAAAELAGDRSPEELLGKCTSVSGGGRAA